MAVPEDGAKDNVRDQKRYASALGKILIKTVANTASNGAEEMSGIAFGMSSKRKIAPAVRL